MELHITVIKSSVNIHSLDILLKDVAKNESISNQKPHFLLCKLHSLGMVLGSPLRRVASQDLADVVAELAN